MRVVTEIVADALNTRYGSPSGAIFDIVQQLSVDGRFDEVAMVLSNWFEGAPHARHFVLAKLPAIIVERYLRIHAGMSSDRFVRWQLQSSAASEAIKNAACSRERLPLVVSQVLAQIRAFEVH